jgi:hypothetical protein
MATLAARGAGAILGAVVGDAASLGTHWLYARAAVEKAVGGPLGTGGEFTHPPIPAYHAARRAGQGTMYAEGLLCMLRALATNDNHFTETAFLEEWRKAFGLCGTFSGYADHTTRATLYNMLTLAHNNEAATAPPKSVPEAARGPLYLGVKAAAAALSGEALAARAAAVAAEAGAPGEAPWAVAAAAAWERMRGPVASEDVESNTLGKLVPAAVAAAGKADFAERVARAIRVTQGSEEVLGHFVPLARAIEAVVLGSATTPRAAVEAALAHYDEAHGARVREALAAADAGEDTWAATARFGASCKAANTAPMVAFVLARYGGEGFEAAIRHNLVGDSASRACIIGAVLGGLGVGSGGGPPGAWVARLDPALREETLALASTIAGRL